ncbi:MAG: HAMP domain-containing protein [Gammaproteobacteria bacterium]
MNIRRKLKIIVALSSAVALIGAGMLYYSNRISVQIQRKTALSQSLAKDIVQLNTLAFYATQPDGNSARQQWLRKQASIVENLKSPQENWNQAELSLMRKIADMIVLIRGNMEESAGADGSLLPDYERRLYGQTLIFSQAIAADSRELATLVLMQGRLRRERANRIFLPLTILLAIGVPLIATRIYLNITRTLSRLQIAVERLQHGDLSYRTHMKPGDELSALGVAFDGMASSIQNSHARLSEEVAAHRTSEEKVRKLNAELEHLVAVRTAELASVQAELSLAQQRQSEAHYLAQSDQSKTAEPHTFASMISSAPESFDELIVDYQSLLEKAMQRALYHTDEETNDLKTALVEKLSRLQAGPRDVMDIHIQALHKQTSDLNAKKRQAYIEEARYLLLEIMGNLTAHYRNLTITLPAGENSL